MPNYRRAKISGGTFFQRHVDSSISIRKVWTSHARRGLATQQLFIGLSSADAQCGLGRRP